MCAVGVISRGGRNVTNMGIKTTFYSLAVETSFYSDTGRVVGSFMKLSNREGYLDG